MGRFSLVVPDTSPNPLSEFGAQFFRGFPKDVVILSGIKVEFILQILPAGIYDLQTKTIGKACFVVHAPTDTLLLIMREISHHETGATNLGNDLIVNLVHV